jgi:hypothetical protein
LGCHFVTCICIGRHKYCAMCSLVYWTIRRAALAVTIFGYPVLGKRRNCGVDTKSIVGHEYFSCQESFHSCVTHSLTVPAMQSSSLWVCYSFRGPYFCVLYHFSTAMAVEGPKCLACPWKKKRTSRAILISAQGWSREINSESFYSLLQIGLFIDHYQLQAHYIVRHAAADEPDCWMFCGNKMCSSICVCLSAPCWKVVRQMETPRNTTKKVTEIDDQSMSRQNSSKRFYG